MNEKNFITPQGLQKLKQERDALIHRAANSSSDADTVARIFYLTQRIDTLEVVDFSIHRGDTQIHFGATVVLEDLDTDTHVIYQIVGEDEIDPTEGKVSLLSPIGKILLGKKEGENLVLDNHAYTIFNVRYESALSSENIEIQALYEKLTHLRAQMEESLKRGGASFTEKHLEALNARIRLFEEKKMRKSTVNSNFF